VADISMCLGTGCAKKDSCYRFTATPSTYQSYCAFHLSEGECANYWDNANETAIVDRVEFWERIADFYEY